jgi:3-oxoacyl-[acyl-carrier protein] reductase
VIPAAFDLRGRVALVTGAGSPTGIGFATARLLAELGAVVALTSTTERVQERAAELLGTGGGASGHVADLTVEAEAVALVSGVVERHGGLDLLVNNAGMTSVGTSGVHPGASAESGGVLGLSLATWRAGVSRNLDTAFLMTREAAPHLVRSEAGRIVYVASVTGPVMAMQAEAAYASAKAALVGLARSVAVDLGPSGVTSNAVAPGWIATGSQTEHEAEQGRTVPLRRSAHPDEVAATIAWLCTPGAGYVTGQCIVVDGGNSVAEERA